ncbi:MAG: hypothetical protein HOI19_06270, partial [Rhodospirillaceae bacterium]|nr:hypothetical protein [Rhodospirillaceae bacterium]
MNNLPLFFTMKDRRVLIAGGGIAAARKADLMVRAECAVTIVAPTLNEDLTMLAEAGRLVHKTDALTASDLTDCVIAVGASEDGAVNEHLHQLAKAAG